MRTQKTKASPLGSHHPLLWRLPSKPVRQPLRSITIRRAASPKKTTPIRRSSIT